MASSLRKALPAAVREIRLHLCQTGRGSSGVRSFVETAYPAIKSANPTLPILIREAAGTPARAFVRFGHGVEKQASLQGVESAAEVETRLAGLVEGKP